MSDHTDAYGLTHEAERAKVKAPDLAWRPRAPKGRPLRIGLVGCGGVAAHHLGAYRKAGFDVVAMSDRHPERMAARQRDYYPTATLHATPEELIANPAVEVVDLTPHPRDRYALTVAALEAGKHVLSQKPFVTDLAQGQELVALARSRGVKLAVNQNGRFAPHLSYAVAAVRSGVLGELSTVVFDLAFDHNWTASTPFNSVHHLILYDYAIHWFDITQALLGQPASSVMASVARSRGQEATPPLLAHALIEGGGAQVTLAINGDTRYGQHDRTTITGTKGTLVSFGPNLNEQRVLLSTEAGHAEPELSGAWFDDGFAGAMSELMAAVEADDEPFNGARENLSSLALCFAAIASADEGVPKAPGSVRSLPAGSTPA